MVNQMSDIESAMPEIWQLFYEKRGVRYPMHIRIATRHVGSRHYFVVCPNVHCDAMVCWFTYLDQADFLPCDGEDEKGQPILCSVH